MVSPKPCSARTSTMPPGLADPSQVGCTEGKGSGGEVAGSLAPFILGPATFEVPGQQERHRAMKMPSAKSGLQRKASSKQPNASCSRPCDHQMAPSVLERLGKPWRSRSACRQHAAASSACPRSCSTLPRLRCARHRSGRAESPPGHDPPLHVLAPAPAASLPDCYAPGRSRAQAERWRQQATASGNRLACWSTTARLLCASTSVGLRRIASR